jgi:hypothetical protein
MYEQLRRCAVVIALSLATWTVTNDAHAATDDVPDVFLSWKAPDKCPDETRVASSVKRHLGRPTVQAANSRTLVANARVEARAGGSYRVQLEISRDDLVGRRVLEDVDCAQLAEAIAFIIAVAADPRVLDRPAATPQDDAKPAPEMRNSALDPIIKMRKRRRLGGSLGISGGAGFGALPALGGGIRLGGGLRVAGWGVEASGSYWFPRSTTARGTHPEAGEVTGHADLLLATGAVMGCHYFARGKLEIPVCAGLEAGSLRVIRAGLDLPESGTGSSSANSRDVAVFWMALDAALGLTMLVHERVGVTLRAEAAVPFRQHDIYWKNLDLAFEVGPASLRVIAGVEGRFGAR